MTVVILSGELIFRGRPVVLGGVVAAMLAGQGSPWQSSAALPRHCSMW